MENDVRNAGCCSQETKTMGANTPGGIRGAVLGATDPWKHRSEGMRCKTCMWFAKKDAPHVRPSEQDPLAQGTVGRCRRHAPTMGGYPVVFVNDWCGDHRLNENAV